MQILLDTNSLLGYCLFDLANKFVDLSIKLLMPKIEWDFIEDH